MTPLTSFEAEGLTKISALDDSPSARAWFTLALLCWLYALSFADRLILSLLATPIAADLHVGDGEMSLLLGAGFAVIYSLAGLPIAFAIDRGNRRIAVCVGVLIWSATTAASAFAQSFGVLLMLRAGVALGEAVLTPAAVSLIGDMFHGERRSGPTAAYGAMSSIMAPGAFLVGAGLLYCATQVQNVAGLVPWRTTFLLLGTPGIVSAIVFLLAVREPRRASPLAPANTSSLSEPLMPFVKQHRGFLLPFYLALGLFALVSMGTLSWMPTALVRGFGMTVSNAGLWFGAAGVCAGTLSAMLWPALTARLSRGGRGDAPVRVLFMSTALSTVALACGSFGSLGQQLTAVFVAVLGLTSIGMVAPMAIQAFSPPGLRARMTSIYLLATGLFGYATGPLVIVRLSQPWHGDPKALAHGIAATAALAGSSAALLFLRAMRNAGSIARY